MNTEEKAKVFAAVWGTEFIQFLVSLAVFAQGRYEDKDELPQDDLKIRMNSSYYSKLS